VPGPPATVPARFEGHQPGSPAYRRLNLALFAGGLATFAQLYSTQAVLPELAADFDQTPSSSALSLSAATLGIGIALLVVGPLTESLGRTPLMKASLVASCVVGVACVLAPGWPALLGLRFLQGVALAGFSAVALAYLREEVSPAHQGRAAGLYVGGTAIGGMVGRLLTGFVADAGGWRWGVASVTALGAVCAIVVIVTLPDSQGFQPSTGGLRGAWTRTRAVTTDRALLLIFAVSALLMGGFVATYNALGFRLAAPPYDLGVGLASLVFLSYALGSVGSTVAGALVDRVGRRTVLPLALLIAIVGLALTLAGPLWVVVIGIALLTIGFFGAHGVASGWSSDRAALVAGAPGQAASLYLLAFYLGSSVFGTLSGVAWIRGGWDLVVVVVGVLFVLALACAVGLRRVPSLRQRRIGVDPAAGH
jgi:YNFM family putative membrane transporter